MHDCNHNIYITDTLKWTQNITNISSKANYLTYNILKTFNTPDINLYILLYKTYIRPIVEYNTSIWTPHLITEIRQIEAVQKRFTRKLCQKLNISFKDYKHRLGLLNIESLEYRRIKFDLILLYKIFNNLIDVDFNQLFKLSEVTDKYNLRRHVLHLQKPKFAKTSIRNNFFSYRIINIWNRLPEVCVCSPTLAVFKKNLNSTNLYCVHNFVFWEFHNQLSLHSKFLFYLCSWSYISFSCLDCIFYFMLLLSLCKYGYFYTVLIISLLTINNKLTTV